MNLIKFIRARRMATNPAKISIRNILAVFQAWFRKKRRSLGGFDLPDHMYEQIIWRRTQVMQKSPKCWIHGFCTSCGCEIIGKTMEDRGCKSCYPEMYSKENWEAFKRINNIKLFD